MNEFTDYILGAAKGEKINDFGMANLLILLAAVSFFPISNYGVDNEEKESIETEHWPPRCEIYIRVVYETSLRKAKVSS